MRAHRTTFRHLVRQLGLPDDDGGDLSTERANRNRTAALARWSRSPGA
jgi:hypothetical protein